MEIPASPRSPFLSQQSQVVLSPRVQFHERLRAENERLELENRTLKRDLRAALSQDAGDR